MRTFLPTKISPSNLACLNRNLAYAKCFAWGDVSTISEFIDATGITHCYSAGRRRPGASPFLVSDCLLRQYGLLPNRLRSVGGNGFWLALCPDRQPVPA